MAWRNDRPGGVSWADEEQVFDQLARLRAARLDALSLLMVREGAPTATRLGNEALETYASALAAFLRRSFSIAAVTSSSHGSFGSFVGS